MVNYWYTDIQSGSGGVSSYVQFARFNNIHEWSDPALFICVIENFTSLTTLWISQTHIPGGLPERILCRGLGKNVTTLHLRSPLCSFPTVISTIFAFPSLQNLFIDTFAAMSGETLLTSPVLPRSGQLQSLQVTRSEYRVAETLANLQFTSRSLILDVRIKTLQSLLALSSATVVDLGLQGACSLRVYHRNINDDLTDSPDSRLASHPIDLPRFPVLTSLKICGIEYFPTHHLIDALSSISSAPALASVILDCGSWPESGSDLSPAWDRLDMWLTQKARNPEVKDGLVLTLARWEEGEKLVPKTLFPKFGEVAKIITTPLSRDTHR